MHIYFSIGLDQYRPPIMLQKMSGKTGVRNDLLSCGDSFNSYRLFSKRLTLSAIHEVNAELTVH